MNLAEQTKLLWFASAGDKKREDTIYKFLTKAHDASYAVVDGQKVFNENHLVQTTELSQPRIVGGIAPGSKLTLYNGNGEARYLTHPEIAFSELEPWSLVIVLNWNGANITNSNICDGKGVSPYTEIRNRTAGSNTFYVFLGDSLTQYAFSSGSSNVTVGKTTVLHFVANLTYVSLYINGVFYETKYGSSTKALFKQIFSATGAKQNSKLFYHRLQSGAMTATQVSEEYTMLRAIYPEIESVDIGTQTWATSNLDMVATPEGNVIQEMQLAANTEKITNADDREFNSDTGFWTNSAQVTIGSGVANILSSDTSYQELKRANLVTSGKWIKVDFDIVRSGSGAIKLAYETGAYYQSLYAVDSYSYYIKALGSSIIFARQGGVTDIDIDNVSIHEVGWSGLGDLYTWLTTTGGYSAYDALKECAAWCYYNNDADNGAVYGKLYNWYAASLLDTDMASAGFGWHIPASSEFNALATELGGTSAAGGKMKVEGTDYWSDPNGDATNESGFTLLGGGFIDKATGGSYSLNFYSHLWTIDKYSATITKTDGTISLTNRSGSELYGFSIRLIKD